MKSLSVGGSSPVTPIMVVKALAVGAVLLVIGLVLALGLASLVIRLLVGDSMF